MIANPFKEQFLILHAYESVCMWSWIEGGAGYPVLMSQILVFLLINDLCTVTLALDLDLVNLTLTSITSSWPC